MKKSNQARTRLIRFRRLSRPVTEIDGYLVETWEIAFSEADLHAKLDGQLAEVHMPGRPWYVRMWRRFFPLRFREVQLTAEPDKKVTTHD